MTRIDGIVGGRFINGHLEVSLRVKAPNAEETLSTNRTMQRQLRLLKREVRMTCKQIKAVFAQRSSQGPGSAFIDGLKIGFFGRRTYYRARGREREHERQQKHDALAPYETVLRIIDNLLLQIDTAQLRIDELIDRRDASALIELASPPDQSTPSTPFSGTITWQYADSTSETFPVTRVVLSAPGTLTFDCDCGTPKKPYIYTIQTHSDDGTHFQGTFSAGRSAPSREAGTVSGIFEHTSAGCRLTGVWIEGSTQSDWVAVLSHHFRTPDQDANTFKFSCPHCGQHISATSDFVGSEASCPSCNNAFVVPSQNA